TFQPVEFIVSLTFRSAFEDVFAIRGLFQGQRGKLHHPAWENHTLRFDYDGADKLYRSLKVHFAPIPDGKNQDTAFFRIALQPKESRQLLVSLQLSESADRPAGRSTSHPVIDRGPVEARLRSKSEAWLKQETEVISDSLMLNRILDRSLRDL